MCEELEGQMVEARKGPWEVFHLAERGDPPPQPRSDVVSLVTTAPHTMATVQNRECRGEARQEAQ